LLRLVQITRTPSLKTKRKQTNKQELNNKKEEKQHFDPTYIQRLLSCLYRPPDSTVSFFDSLAYIVDTIAAENKEVGDFNVDLIKKSTSESKQILHLMEYQGFQQMGKTPTRITENSSTLIDHYYYSNPEHVLSITSPRFC